MREKFDALANGYNSFGNYRLKSVVLWATGSTEENAAAATVRHWISSYRFEEVLASDLLHRKADMTNVQVTGLRVATQEEIEQAQEEIALWLHSGKQSEKFPGFWTWEGVSLDMCQPFNHVHNLGKLYNTVGTLAAFARSISMLVSERSRCGIEVFFKVPLTVTDVTTYILDHKLHCYEFQEDSGSGCLFWQLELMRDFQELGWIDAADLQKIESQVQAYAKQRGEVEVPWPPKEGTFLDRQALPARRKP